MLQNEEKRSVESYDLQDGKKVGRAEGEKFGRAEGEKFGRAEGKKIGISALIETCRELGVSETDTIARLVQKFELTREEAEEAYNCYTV